ncbi:hypothetical protein [Streptomyces adustus]|uniref:hypothetical protein n=1 Tax=Streptomyces adustus TaxID=1609272 RepID=UPI003084633C
MNTERPDNDDAAREPGVAETAGEEEGLRAGTALGAGADAKTPTGTDADAGTGADVEAGAGPRAGAGADTDDVVPGAEDRPEAGATAVPSPAAPVGDDPAGDGTAPVGNGSAEDAPLGNASAEDGPLGDAAAEDSPAEDTEGGTIPVGDSSAEDASAEDGPLGNASAEDTEGGTTPVGDSSAEDGPLASASAEDKPVGDASVEAGLAGDAPLGDASVGDASVGAGGASGSGRDAEVGRVSEEGSGGGDGLGDHDGRPASRRRSPVVVASVAAAVLLVGGGGAYLAASASGGRTGAGASAGDGTPAPLALDGYSAPGTSGNGGTANGIAPGEPNPYGVTYRAAGTLPDGPGSAPVYWATGDVTRDEVARLAEAFGIDGTPVAQGTVWKVGTDKDGAGPVLRVNKAAPGAWTFSRYAPGTDDCKNRTLCIRDPAGPIADPVSEAAAKKAAAPVLKALGQDDAKVDASQVMGAQRVVNADPTVGGLPTYGLTTGLTVGAQGELVGGNGQLTTPLKGDVYPALSAREALDLLNKAPGTDHRMGIGGCASPVPLKDRLEEPCGSSTAPDAGTRTTVTVEDAVFGLAVHRADERLALVPSWLFTARGTGAQDDFTVTYPAVEPDYLTPSVSAGPTTAPSTHDVRVEGYRADDSELVVRYTGGVCADYRATAVESADRVTVKVTETPWPNKICIKIAKTFDQSVRLDRPLGDRKVVGSDGREVPAVTAGTKLQR